jgi:hypothetical protein
LHNNIRNANESCTKAYSGVDPDIKQRILLCRWELESKNRPGAARDCAESSKELSRGMSMIYGDVSFAVEQRCGIKEMGRRIDVAGVGVSLLFCKLWSAI